MSGGLLAFVEAGERLFFGGPVTVGRKGKQLQPIALPSRIGAIRQKLKALSKRAPEVMVKVTGNARDAKGIRANLRCISRRGQIELEDQEGQVHRGKDAVTDVLHQWQSEFPIVDSESQAIGSDSDGVKKGGRRESFQIILSIPGGTPHTGLMRAIREFASTTFADHQYVLAFHTPETDPDPEPSPHPHAHLTVKTRSRTGHRLNPRKADLQRWREHFASRLGEHGIDAIATARPVRGQREPGRGQKNAQMDARGATRGNATRRIPADRAVQTNRRTAQSVLADWGVVLETLDRSNDPQDRHLHRALATRLGLSPAIDQTRMKVWGPGVMGPKDLGHDR